MTTADFKTGELVVIKQGHGFWDCTSYPFRRQRVLDAARAVVASPKSDIAIEALDAALVSHTVAIDAIAERKRLDEEGRKNAHYGRRCNVSEYDARCGIPLSIHVADGDTWEEVLEKLKAKQKGKQP